jgi:hypothetical protein
MRVAIVASLGLMVSASAEARPGSFERHPLGADTAGLGGAGIGAAGSAWFNPAGLGWVFEEGVSASGSAYGYVIERAPEFVNIGIGDGSITGRLANTSLDLFPASLQYGKPLGKIGKLTHGIGLSVMMPDYDQFDGVIEVPSEDFLFEIRGRRIAESRTFWAVLAWGLCEDYFCIGFGPAAAIHLEKETTITTIFTELGDGNTIDAGQTSQAEMLVAAIGGQVGVQYHVGKYLHLGLTVRTPVAKLFSKGSLLTTSSIVDTTQDIAYVDRVDVQKPKLDYKVPWRIGLGLLFEVPRKISFAADLRITTAMSEYSLVLGPNGEEELAPAVPGGTIDDPSRALGVKRAAAFRPAVNFNTGLRFYATDTIALHFGGFSDFSATSDDDTLRNYNEKLHRLGATVGGGWAGDDITTWVTAVYAYGWGSTVGIGEGFEEELTPLRSHSIHVMLGSTADF